MGPERTQPYQSKKVVLLVNSTEGNPRCLPSSGTRSIGRPSSSPVPLWCLFTSGGGQSPPVPKERPFQRRNVMRGRVMTIVISAVLVGSPLAPGAQAGGYEYEGGGHIGRFGDGYRGDFGGRHIAHVHYFVIGRRHFVGPHYKFGSDCAYFTPYSWPFTCRADFGSRWPQIERNESVHEFTRP